MNAAGNPTGSFSKMDNRNGSGGAGGLGPPSTGGAGGDFRSKSSIAGGIGSFG